MLVLWPFFAGLQVCLLPKKRLCMSVCVQYTLLKAWATEDCGTHSYIAENEDEEGDIHTHVKTATILQLEGHTCALHKLNLVE